MNGSMMLLRDFNYSRRVVLDGRLEAQHGSQPAGGRPTRGHSLSSPSSSTPLGAFLHKIPPPGDAVHKYRDDSDVHTESRNKEDNRQRPKRRGASFNVRQPKDHDEAKSPWQQLSSHSSFSDADSVYRGDRYSGDGDRTPRTLDDPYAPSPRGGVGAPRPLDDPYAPSPRGSVGAPRPLDDPYAASHRPLDDPYAASHPHMPDARPLNYYDLGTSSRHVAPSISTHTAAERPDVAQTSSAAWHSGGMLPGHAGAAAVAPSSELSRMKKSLSYSSAGATSWSAQQSQPFSRRSLDNVSLEGHPGPHQPPATGDLRRSLDPLSKAGYSVWRPVGGAPLGDSYVNRSVADSGYHSTQSSVSQWHGGPGAGRVAGEGGRDPYRDQDEVDPMVTSHGSAREPSSLNPYGHEGTTWPVTSSGVASGAMSDPSHQAGQTGLAFQHLDQKMSPNTLRRLVAENRTRAAAGPESGMVQDFRSTGPESGRHDFHRAVVDRLQGTDLDLRTNPGEAASGMGVPHRPGGDSSNAVAARGGDGEGRSPSPPPQGGFYAPSREFMAHYSQPNSTTVTMATTAWGSPPAPALPATSPPHQHTPVMVTTAPQTRLVADAGTQGGPDSISDPTTTTTTTTTRGPLSAAFPVIIRSAKPCYNTFTQTEAPPDGDPGGDRKTVEIQVDADSLHRNRVQKEEKSVQARWGSIVGHSTQHSPPSDPDEEGIYEKLIFPERRATDSGIHAMDTPTGVIQSTTSAPYSPRDAGLACSPRDPGFAHSPRDPGFPYSPRDPGLAYSPRDPGIQRPTTTIADRHRIPETIEEDQEIRGPPRHSGSRGTSAAGISLQPVPDSAYKRNRNVQGDLLMQQIQEQPPSQTRMLRKLSQEYFGRAGMGSRMIPDKGIHQPPSRRTSEEEADRPGHGGGVAGAPGASRTPRLHGAGSGEEVGAEEGLGEEGDELGDLPTTPGSPPNTQYFDRNKNMSLRKAYGIFEEVEGWEGHGARVPMGRHGNASSHPGGTRGAVSLHRKEASLDGSGAVPGAGSSRAIAEAAREGWVSGPGAGVAAGGLGKLRRTTSEQLQPVKERRREKERRRSKSPSPRSRQRRGEAGAGAGGAAGGAAGGVASREDRHKTSDPTPASATAAALDRVGGYHHSYGASDPTHDTAWRRGHPSQPSPAGGRTAPSSRAGSQAEGLGCAASPASGPHQAAVAKATTRSAKGSEDARLSDPELKKYQQQQQPGLLGVFQGQKDQRLSTSSSADGSGGPGGVGGGSDRDLHSPHAARLDPRARPAPKAASLPHGMAPPPKGDSLSAEEYTARAGGGRLSLPEAGGRRRSNSGEHHPRRAAHSTSDLPPVDPSPPVGRLPVGGDDPGAPPLLDTTKQHTLMDTSLALSPVSDYSPPPHPWNQNQLPPEKPARRGQPPTEGDTKPAKDQKKKRRRSSNEQPGSQREKDGEQTHPKAVEASASSSASVVSASSAESGGASVTSYQYHVTHNKNFKESDDVDEKPPSLPPRNYRGTGSADVGRDVPKPFSAPPGAGCAAPHSYTSDYDATPKADSYADQVRQQARRISQSHSSLLPAARYQSRPLADMPRASISVSRPVDKPPSAQATRMPQPLYRTAQAPTDLNLATLSPDGAEGGRAADLKRSSLGAEPHSPTGSSAAGLGGGRAAASSPRTRSPLSGSQPPASPLAVLMAPAIVHSPGDPRDTASPRPHQGYYNPAYQGALQQPPHRPLGGATGDSEARDRAMSETGTNGQRYTSESHLSSPGLPTTAYVGNFIRPGDASSPSGTALSGVALRQESSPVVNTDMDDDGAHVASSGERTWDLAEEAHTTPNRTIAKPYLDPPWGKRVLYPASLAGPGPGPGGQPRTRSPAADGTSTYTSPRGEGGPSDGTPSEGSDARWRVPDESGIVTESPSVRACISNFESLSPKPGRRTLGVAGPRVSKKPVVQGGMSGGNKISELRENIILRSNENLTILRRSDENIAAEGAAPGMHRDNHRDRDGSLSSMSRSNESLDDDPFSAAACDVITRSTEKVTQVAISPARSTIIAPNIGAQQSSQSGKIGHDPSPRQFNASPGQFNPSPRQFNASPGQFNPSQVNPSPRHFDSSPQQFKPRQADPSPRQVDPSPRQADPSPRQIDPSPRQADPSPRQVDPSPRQADPSPRQADPSPRQADPSPRQIDPSPRQADPSPRQADPSPRTSAATQSPSPSNAPSATTPSTGSIRHNSPHSLALQSPGAATATANGHPSAATNGHARQKSQEEIEYEEQAVVFAHQIQNRKGSKELLDVILPPPEHKTTTDYMSGLFDINIDPGRSLASDVTPRPTDADMNSRNEAEVTRTSEITAETVDVQKEALVARLEKKLQILCHEIDAIKDDITVNETLGEQVTAIVKQKVQSPQEFSKYKLYVDELDKVLYLLIKLSGRLAQAENELHGLPATASESYKMALTSKRDDLSRKHSDARRLKEGIDRRRVQVTSYLRKYLTDEEFTDYEHFCAIKTKLTLDKRAIEDEVKLGDEQLSALKKSMQITET